MASSKDSQCDQGRPACLRCSRNGRECVYEEAAASAGSQTREVSSDEATPADRQETPSQSSSISIQRPVTVSLVPVVAESSLETLNPWIKKNGTSVDNLWHHFSNNSAAIMGQPLSTMFWDLACKYDFLALTMLAVSACHLRNHTANSSPHYIAEIGQESAAINALKSALAIPLDRDRASALLFTAVMLNAITFAFVESSSPSDSWVFSESPDRLYWLDLQLRFRKLQEATSQFRDPGSMKPLIDETTTGGDVASQPDAAEDLSLARVPPAWKRMIGNRDEKNHDLYREPVRLLAELRLLKPDCDGSFAYMGLIGKLDNGFRDLLYEKDPRALWIFGYWLGLLGRLGIWWCSSRVERDWAAVLCFLQKKELDQQAGEEGRMWQSLIADLRSAADWPPRPVYDVF